jgi:hypothetical protein
MKTTTHTQTQTQTQALLLVFFEINPLRGKIDRLNEIE